MSGLRSLPILVLLFISISSIIALVNDIIFGEAALKKVLGFLNMMPKNEPNKQKGEITEIDE
jgi:hypothetical protein